LFALTLALMSTLLTLRLEAQIPRAPACDGTDFDAAARALEEGDRAMRDAARGAGQASPAELQALYETALTAYAEACAQGDDQALERMAIPLYQRGRSAEAMRALDAFLQAHPPGTLEGNVRRRVESNRERITASVATLRIETREGAVVFLRDAMLGRAPLADLFFSAAGDVEVRVESPGFQPALRHIALTLGQTTTLSVELVPNPVPGSFMLMIPQTQRAHVPLRERLMPLTIAAFVLGPVLLVGGVVATIFTVDQTLTSPLGPVLAALGFGLGSGITVTGVVLLVEIGKDDRANASLQCGFGPFALQCAGTF
jgi:hypothetical protein